ncbi:MAG: zf-HC2 domain-containing protein [Kiritimatiellae bacterium]|nr:zf-HC2 domain-containing protein [Kiritimatiellia bacterium]
MRKHKTTSSPQPVRDAAPERHLPVPGRPVECGQIEEVLFDYMSRELGDAQSLLVHEHLRHCASCRRAAAEMQKTMDFLRAHDPGLGVAAHLSESRRRRLIRAVMHPVMDWIIVHHWLVALLAAVAVIGAALALTTLCYGRAPEGAPVWILRWRGAP